MTHQTLALIGLAVGLSALGIFLNNLRNNKTVAAVTAKFDRMVSDLGNIEAKARRAISDHQDMIAEHDAAIDAHSAEANAAARVKAKIAELVK